MKDEELKQRMKELALRAIRWSEALPKSVAGDFVSKMGIVEDDADESGLWLELITESGLPKSAKTCALRAEASECTAMAVATIRTASCA